MGITWILAACSSVDMGKGFSADFGISTAYDISVVRTNIILRAPDAKDPGCGPPELRISVVFLAKAVAVKVRRMAVNVAKVDAICQPAVFYCCVSIWLVQFVVRVAEEIGVECTVEIV